jgi:hypothetical protein
LGVNLTSLLTTYFVGSRQPTFSQPGLINDDGIRDVRPRLRERDGGRNRNQPPPTPLMGNTNAASVP